MEAVKDAVETAETTDEAAVEVIPPQAAKPDATPLNEVSGWTEAEDEERVGWLIISDGEQEVLPHPEGKTRLEIIEGFLKAKSKKQHAFQLGFAVLDPEVITTFAWSKDVMFPEIDKFDGIQDRMEALADAMTDLARQQAALQDAHAALIQDEMLHAEDGDEDEDEGMIPEVMEASAPMPAATPVKPKATKKGFRPPGA